MIHIHGAGGILLILFLLGCVGNEPPAVENAPLEESGWENTPIFEQHAQQNKQSLEETKEFFSQTYQIQSEEDIFAALEPKPPQFEEEKKWLYDGNSESMGWISTQTYERPELYPTFDTSGKGAWINAPTQYPFSAGLLGTPSQQASSIPTTQKEFSTHLFVGASWGVTTRQAGSMHYTISPDANIQIDFTPTHIFLGRTFPQFDKGWVERIRIRGRILENVEPGTYTIKVFATTPDAGVEWDQVEYYPIDPTFSSSEGLATLQLTIIP